MKKLAIILLALILLVGCSNGKTENTETAANSEKTVENNASQSEKMTDLKVGATIVPHAEILEQVKDVLAEQGINLIVVEFSDYVQPNLALDAGDLDANYFQHTPYLESFNKERGLNLVSVGKIHYEPLGIYRGSKSSLDELTAGDKISVPNDATNEARALALLEAQGVLKIREDAGLNATKLDIVDNPKNIEIVELEAAQLGKSIQDVAFSVINGNYALQSGLTADQAVAFESKDSVGADTFANVLVVKAGNENDPAIQALLKALQSDAVKEFIQEHYQGAVEASF